MTTSLTFFTFRFDCIAQTSIKLDGYQAGERLRDALANVMLRATCPENPRRQLPTSEHAATCPACWLLAANLAPGEARRVYSLVPPLPPVDVLAPGQAFSFALTLFGEGIKFLPYFLLALQETGRDGVGPGRGYFENTAITAINPLKGEEETLWQKGASLVTMPETGICFKDAAELAAGWLPRLPNQSLAVDFLSPTRLIEAEALVKTPDFGVFFHRLLKRIDDLAKQCMGQSSRSKEDVDRLHSLADRVRLVEADTRWVELSGPSGRTGRRTPMSGFVGRATYRSPHWPELLPWILFGQGVQVGKLTAKGNGVYCIIQPQEDLL